MGWTLFAARGAYRTATSESAMSALSLPAGVLAVAAVLSPPYFFAKYVLGIEGEGNRWGYGYLIVVGGLGTIYVVSAFARVWWQRRAERRAQHTAVAVCTEHAAVAASTEHVVPSRFRISVGPTEDDWRRAEERAEARTAAEVQRRIDLVEAGRDGPFVINPHLPARSDHRISEP